MRTFPGGGGMSKFLVSGGGDSPISTSGENPSFPLKKSETFSTSHLAKSSPGVGENLRSPQGPAKLPSHLPGGRILCLRGCKVCIALSSSFVFKYIIFSPSNLAVRIEFLVTLIEFITKNFKQTFFILKVNSLEKQINISCFHVRQHIFWGHFCFSHFINSRIDEMV